MRKARGGDSEALSWLYQQYNRGMFNICTRMTGTRNDAEDILQEAFIIAFQKLHQLKEDHLFGGWLRKIVMTECIRFAKQTFYWSDWNEQYDDMADDTDDDWWLLVSPELIQQEIKLLPDGCRQIFNLYTLEDYAHKEIAGLLGISESTSKSQYQRARQLLKERLTKKVATDGSF
ncbi:RNA polymerase sigma-70 factor (ECF subfamily) [Filimonas zeae]|uniref:RNA polymerase sigma factor n=1 Tax=Filimonas zeae TaxID=1737353 RepID=UPI00166E1A40|nr:RNA polymerase sigma factor [Filimonas zeae]MDR6338596.1 RNA polymerase sigma-70 factor (ECF subfamily) [Filimonas zeae]